MTDTTGKGFSFPEGTDLLINGNEAIQALAESVDDYLSAAAWLLRTSVQTIPTGVATDVVWTAGSSALTAEFALSAGDTVLTYTGVTRWFAYDVKGSWPAQVDAVRQLTLMLNGSTYHFDNADLTTPAGGNGNRYAGLVPLATGYTLKLTTTHIAGADRDLSPSLILVGL